MCDVTCVCVTCVCDVCAAGKKHEAVYKTPRYRGTSFTVVHYAGAVQYSLEGVLEKNRDTLRHSLAFVMRSECRA